MSYSQFTIRGLLVAIALVAVVLALSKWLGGLAAMISVLVIAFVLILVAWLIARAARHYTRRTLMSPLTNPRTKVVPDDWANKPLTEFDDESKPNDQINE